jgi:3-oxoacyl-[acyl-carrier protein] reductase
MTGCEVEWMPLDLSLPDSAVTLLEAVSRRFGKAHVLINNACFWLGDSIATLDAASLDRHYAVNTRAPILLSVEFVRRFAEKGARRIISMTSGQMLGPIPGSVAYAASKAALDAFTITLADEGREIRHHGECGGSWAHRHRLHDSREAAGVASAIFAWAVG